MVAKAGIGGSGRGGIAGRTDEPRGKLEGAADLGQADAFEIHVVQPFEVAFGEADDGLGEDELAFPQRLLLDGGLPQSGIPNLDEQVGALSGAGGEAFAPVELDGPALDGAHGDAGLARDGGIAAVRAEFEVGAEGLKGARRFIGSGRKRGSTNPGWGSGAGGRGFRWRRGCERCSFRGWSWLRFHKNHFSRWWTTNCSYAFSTIIMP